MDYVKINGRVYDNVTIELSRDFTILYSDNTGRSLAPGAPMLLDPLGTFYQYKITFAKRNGHEKEFEDLWDYLSVPRDYGIPVEFVYNQKTIAYDSYVSNGSQKLKRIDKENGTVIWNTFEATFSPIKAQVTP